MAGYDKIFLFGRPGPDGVTDITMELWRGGSDRMWLEPARGFKSREIKITVLIPRSLDEQDMLLDAAMAFARRHLRKFRNTGKCIRSWNRVSGWISTRTGGFRKSGTRFGNWFVPYLTRW